MYHPQNKPHNFLPSQDMAFPCCLRQSLPEAQSTSVGVTTQRTIPLSPYLPQPHLTFVWNGIPVRPSFCSMLLHNQEKKICSPVTLLHCFTPQLDFIINSILFRSHRSHNHRLLNFAKLKFYLNSQIYSLLISFIDTHLLVFYITSLPSILLFPWLFWYYSVHLPSSPCLFKFVLSQNSVIVYLCVPAIRHFLYYLIQSLGFSLNMPCIC